MTSQRSVNRQKGISTYARQYFRDSVLKRKFLACNTPLNRAKQLNLAVDDRRPSEQLEVFTLLPVGYCGFEAA